MKHRVKSILTLTAMFFLQLNAVLANTTLTSINSCVDCTACNEASGSFATLPFKEFPFLIVLEIILILLLAKANRLKKLFWVVGLTCFIGLSMSVSSLSSVQENHPSSFSADSTGTILIAVTDMADSLSASDLDEFTPMDSDEFESIVNSDEFVSSDGLDEFEAFTEQPENNSFIDDKEITTLFRTLIALILTVIAGFVYRSSQGRKLRFFIMLGALIYLGFYSSGCPCMISSFQNLILFLLGEPTRWVTLVWIIGLLPITYIFGKIWCGWVCHLGALQEFIYRPTLFKGLQNEKSQRILKYIQYGALVALILQLLITRINFFIKIDPFKVAFNLLSVNATGYVLLAVLLISSILIYRPFCRAICPIGLVLGWIEKIPGASKLQITPSCKSCKQCVKACDSNAISSTADQYIIDQENCIRCGKCLDTCRFKAINQFRKIKTSKIDL